MLDCVGQVLKLDADSFAHLAPSSRLWLPFGGCYWRGEINHVNNFNCRREIP